MSEFEFMEVCTHRGKAKRRIACYEQSGGGMMPLPVPELKDGEEYWRNLDGEVHIVETL